MFYRLMLACFSREYYMMPPSYRHKFWHKTKLQKENLGVLDFLVNKIQYV